MNKAEYPSNSDGKHQLPARAYLDARLLAIEEERIFRLSPKYLASKAAIPNAGDYTTPVAEKNAKVLIRIGEDIILLSNICKHRQSVLLHGSGNVSRIICPLHRWSYHTSGELLKAPKFEPQPSTKLEQFPLQEWNGMLFSQSTPTIAEITQDIDAER